MVQNHQKFQKLVQNHQQNDYNSANALRMKETEGGQPGTTKVVVKRILNYSPLSILNYTVVHKKSTSS